MNYLTSKLPPCFCAKEVILLCELRSLLFPTSASSAPPIADAGSSAPPASAPAPPVPQLPLRTPTPTGGCKPIGPGVNGGKSGAKPKLYSLLLSKEQGLQGPAVLVCRYQKHINTGALLSFLPRFSDHVYIDNLATSEQLTQADLEVFFDTFFIEVFPGKESDVVPKPVESYPTLAQVLVQKPGVKLDLAELFNRSLA